MSLYLFSIKHKLNLNYDHLTNNRISDFIFLSSNDQLNEENVEQNQMTKLKQVLHPNYQDFPHKCYFVLATHVCISFLELSINRNSINSGVCYQRKLCHKIYSYPFLGLLNFLHFLQKNIILIKKTENMLWRFFEKIQFKLYDI